MKLYKTILIQSLAFFLLFGFTSCSQKTSISTTSSVSQKNDNNDLTSLPSNKGSLTEYSNSSVLSEESHNKDTLSTTPIETGIMSSIFQSHKNFIYRETINLPSRIIDPNTNQLLESKVSFDIFIDDNQHEYFYFHNTEVQCGFKEKNVYGVEIPKERFKNNKDIILLSERYLKQITDLFDDYALVGCEYLQNEKIYLVKYNYQIQNINSDDNILLYFRGDGTLGAYSAYRLNKYKDYKPDINIKQIANELITNFQQITDTFITLYDSNYYLIIEGFKNEANIATQICYKL